LLEGTVLFIPPSTKITCHSVKKKDQQGMGGGRPKHESMAVRDVEQSQLAIAATNVEIAGSATI
jgi:hypothetical protein